MATPRRFFNSILCAGLLLASLPAFPSTPQTHIINIENMKFSSPSIEVSPGDTIIWINQDLVPHTVTDLKGRFDSGTINTGKRWHLKVVRKGMLNYFCRFHPLMKAELKIR